MRHRSKGRILSRTTAPRKHLLANLAQSVILHEKVKTTEAKAKEVRRVVERMITSGKKPTLATRRLLLSRLPTENAVKKILEVLSPRYATRNGGYTRITKIGRRQGDAAKMVVLELV